VEELVPWYMGACDLPAAVSDRN